MWRWQWWFPGGAPTPIHYLATTSSISIIAGSRRWDMTRVANSDLQTHTNTGTNTVTNTHKYRNKYRCKYRHKNRLIHRSKRMIFWKTVLAPEKAFFVDISWFCFLASPSLINCCQVQSFAAQMRAGWHGTRLAEQSEHSTLARNTETQCNGGWSVICARYRDTEDTVCREGI